MRNEDPKVRDVATSTTNSVARQGADSFLAGQFRLPTGLVGRVTGWWMARGNKAMNGFAVQRLKVGMRDRVLEVGFGPGQAIEFLVKRTAAHFIAGVDPSPVMVEQAQSRNRDAIDGGRVWLAQGTADALPFGEDEFSRALAVNNFHIWESREGGLAELRRVLCDGGLLLLCLRRAARERRFWSSPGLTPEEVCDDQALLRQLGFSKLQLATRTLGCFGPRVVCLLATK